MKENLRRLEETRRGLEEDCTGLEETRRSLQETGRFLHGVQAPWILRIVLGSRLSAVPSPAPYNLWDRGYLLHSCKCVPFAAVFYRA